MKKYLLVLVFIITAFTGFAQSNSPWQLLGADRTDAQERIRDVQYSENQKLTLFEHGMFEESLTNVADVKSGQQGIEIQFPNVKGELEKYLVWESSNFEPGLQAKFSRIRSFVGKGITDVSARLYFSCSPAGVQTMVFRADKGSEYIEPYTKDNSVYVIFDSATRINGKLPFNCSTPDLALNEGVSNSTNAYLASNERYKTMRLALSCTAEYAQYFGGTVSAALAGMNASMTRVNAVMENDLAVKLIMIDNTSIIFTDPTQDPYDSVDSSGNAPDTWNVQLQATLTDLIGEANYDLGHLFGGSGGGGNSGCIGCVCVNGQKGSAYTSPNNAIPQGDSFDIDYVAHEMGHQLGAEHTFSYGGVAGQEDTLVNVEPGSGSTIMGYAGITGATDVQRHSDAYFANKSISQIQNNLVNKTCAITYTALTNPAFTNKKPTVSGGANYTIPTGTAFKLVGTGSGESGETLTYCWEQNDDASGADIGSSGSFPSPYKTKGPNFRSRVPSLSPIRYMPQFSDVLAGNLYTTWESLSSVARTLNFGFTVRDNVLNGGQTNVATSQITVVDTGNAFAITSPIDENISFDRGSTHAITWDVAGTTANGINTAKVNILLSTDAGKTFSALVSNTANDGSESITLPDTAYAYCRIMIEPVGNIYYAVSKNFGIGYSFSSTCATYTNNTSLTIPDGSGISLPGASVSKTISVPTSALITDVNTTVAGTHTSYWDLVVSLQHPDGTLVRLLNRQCNIGSSGFNVLFNDDASVLTCAPFLTGSFAPYEPLSAFNGKDAIGTWTLTAADYYKGKTGKINNWSVDICWTTPVLSTRDNQLFDLSVYPNPNRGNFTVQFSNPSAELIQVNVFDVRGRRIFENNYVNQSVFNENIQLANAEPGIYLISITAGESKSVKKIIIE